MSGSCDGATEAAVAAPDMNFLATRRSRNCNRRSGAGWQSVVLVKKEAMRVSPWTMEHVLKSYLLVRPGMPAAVLNGLAGLSAVAGFGMRGTGSSNPRAPGMAVTGSQRVDAGGSVAVPLLMELVVVVVGKVNA